MAHPGMSSAVAPPGALPITEPTPGSTHQSLRSPPLPAPSWETINEREDFYDVQDLLDLSRGLTSERLKDRREDDVVIFDYSLDPSYLRGGPPAEEGGPSSGSSSTDDDLLFRVSKNRLIESDQFDQIINSAEVPVSTLSRGSRLGVVDFPQCYDTYDYGLLNSIGEKLGLQGEGETTFTDAHLQRIRRLPGHERFRTGISLRVPFKKLSNQSTSGLSEDRSTLFISIPYLGKYDSRVLLRPECESVKLLEFKHLGVHLPCRAVEASVEERDEIGKILVHQARYMIFDNYTMATFRSKEDSAKDQVPLHRFQERIGAFRAVIHMIANRMDLEVWTLESLQASLHKLEEDIDQLISFAKSYDHNQGMEEIPVGASPAERVHTRAREQEVRKREQSRVRDLLTSLNRLSAALFAAISVAERQIVILQDIHNLFSASCRSKAAESDQRYRSRQNPFHKSSAPIPILSENPEQIFPATLDTIDRVVHERKSSILKIRGLIENVDIGRKMVFGFLGPDPEAAVISGNTEISQRGLDIATEEAQWNVAIGLIAAFFVPFSAWTSIFYPIPTIRYFGMNLREFQEHSYSTTDFWLSAGPAITGAMLLVLVFTTWKHPWFIELRANLAEKL
ncbi:hypothetical protein HOY82DRAFT_621337, partial [Tuber indicum]